VVWIAQCHHFASGKRAECVDVFHPHHPRTHDGVPQSVVCDSRTLGHTSRVIAASFGAVSVDKLYFRQLLSGRDFARDNELAQQMVNFVYAIGDRDTGSCVLVDPAYDVASLIDLVEQDGMKVAGVLATHYHPDHVGGSMMGFRIDGIAALLERCAVPIHVQKSEVEWVTKVTGVDRSHLVAHEPGDIVPVGDVPITLLHTPGHTPGSQCFIVQGRLVSGDTLFLDGCGRTDLPGSDPEQMYDSLQTLSLLPDDTVIFPGHQYSPAAHDTMTNVRRMNAIFKPKSKDAWLGWFGA